MDNQSRSRQVADGISMRIEQSSIHLKAIDPHGDPLELTPQEARATAKALTALADLIDADDGSLP